MTDINHCLVTGQPVQIIGFKPTEADTVLTAVRHAADGLITQQEMLKKLASAAGVEHFWNSNGDPIPLVLG